MIKITQGRLDDVPILNALYDSIGQQDEGYFERVLNISEREILMAHQNGTPAGFVILNWAPRYTLYKKLQIPEIQDLNVIPNMRKQGIATALINECETRAQAKKCTHIGISVGLTAPYGPAQRLYAKMNYHPDGYGVTYDREYITAGNSYSVDDDLCLMLVKEF